MGIENIVGVMETMKAEALNYCGNIQTNVQDFIDSFNSVPAYAKIGMIGMAAFSAYVVFLTIASPREKGKKDEEKYKNKT